MKALFLKDIKDKRLYIPLLLVGFIPFYTLLQPYRISLSFLALFVTLSLLKDDKKGWPPLLAFPVSLKKVILCKMFTSLIFSITLYGISCYQLHLDEQRFLAFIYCFYYLSFLISNYIVPDGYCLYHQMNTVHVLSTLFFLLATEASYLYKDLSTTIFPYIPYILLIAIIFILYISKYTVYKMMRNHVALQAVISGIKQYYDILKEQSNMNPNKPQPLDDAFFSCFANKNAKRSFILGSIIIAFKLSFPYWIILVFTIVLKIYILSLIVVLYLLYYTSTIIKHCLLNKQLFLMTFK